MNHPSTSSQDKKAKKILSLGQKTFHLRPECLVLYLRQQSLTEIAREVFWWHWAIGYKQRSLTTQLSINEVAQSLNISISAVSTAYSQLTQCGLIIRTCEKAWHGGYATARTTIDIPDAALLALCETPDRGVRSTAVADGSTGHDSVKVATHHAQPLGTHDLSLGTDTDAPADQALSEPDKTLDAVLPEQAGTPVHNQPSTEADPLDSDTHAIEVALPIQIEALDQEIAQATEQLIARTEQRDLNGVCQANRQIEQAQTKKRVLQQQQAQRDQGSTVPNKAPSITRPPVLAKPTAPSKTKPVPVRISTGESPSRVLSPLCRDKIVDQVAKLKHVSAPQALVNEIVYSIEQGVQSDKPIPWAINAALKLVRERRWRTPIGCVPTCHRPDNPYPSDQSTPYPTNRRAIM